MLGNTQSIACAFCLASDVPRSPYRHLELCGVALFFCKNFVQTRVAFDQLDERHTQNRAADELANTDSNGIEHRQHRRGCAVREEEGDLERADNDHIKDNGRQGCRNGQPFHADVTQLVGHKAGQQGRQRAEHHVNDGGAEQICQKAAQRDADDILGAEHRQQAEGLGHADLHRAVAERGQHKADDHIDSRNDSAAHKATDGQIFHIHTILRRIDFDHTQDRQPCGVCAADQQPTAEPKILSCSTNLNYNKTRRPLQDLRGKFVVDSAHIVLIWYNASEYIVDYLKIIIP